MTASTRLRQLTLMGIPFAFAILLLFHPLALGHALGKESIYEALRNHVLRWQVVHVLQLLFIGLMGVAIYVLTSTLEGRAATVSRLAAVSFVLFYGAWEAATGIGTGVLVGYANSLPAAEQAVANDIVQAYFDDPLIGNRSLLSVLGMLSWFAALGAAAITFLRAGAPRSVPVLLALSGLAFGLGHPPPLGPIGLAFFIAAMWRLERGSAHVAARPVE